MSYQLRAHDRFCLDPMYTSVTVQRFEDGRVAAVEGHAYDISPGGMRLAAHTAPISAGPGPKISNCHTSFASPIVRHSPLSP